MALKGGSGDKKILGVKFFFGGGGRSSIKSFKL